MPAMAGIRFVAVERMRFVFMMFSGYGRRRSFANVPSSFRGSPRRAVMRYPACGPFVVLPIPTELSNGAEYEHPIRKSQSSYENNYFFVVLLVQFRNRQSC